MNQPQSDLTTPAVQRIIHEQPDYWVFMLAVELLRPGLAEVQVGYDELKIGLLHRPCQPCNDRTFVTWIETRLNELQILSDALTAAVLVDLVAAFGDQVDNVDPAAIQRACNRIVARSQAMLEWERTMQAALFSADFNAVKQRIEGWTVSYFAEVQRLVRELERLYLDPPTSGAFAFTLTLDSPATIAGFADALHLCLVRRGWA